MTYQPTSQAHRDAKPLRDTASLVRVRAKDHRTAAGNLGDMVFDSTRLDLQPYAGFEMDRYVRRTFYSREHSGWDSLLVQRFEHVPVAEDIMLPAARDLHLVLPVAGRAVMETRRGGRSSRHTWAPGRLDLRLPDQAIRQRYRGDGPMRSVQVHIPRGTLDAAAEQLGVRTVDFEAMSASLAMGDRLIEETVRALSVPGQADDLYAEAAATFLSVHLLTRHTRSSAPPATVREDKRVGTAVAMMRSRLAEPITLTDIAKEVHLSVYHLVKVFKDATGVPPHRFLTRLRIEEAKRLLRDTELPIAQIAPRCGFAGPGALSAAFLRHTGVRPSVYRNS